MTITSRASQAVTLTAASLATSSGRTVGRCSASYSNTTNKDEHLAASALITTGTSPTAGVIEVWAFQTREDGTWPDLFTAAYTGSDGGFTVRSREILRAGAVLLGSVVNDTTNNNPYTLQPRDLALLFGTVYVREVAFFLTHSSGVNLNSTSGNHELVISPSYWA